jgi:hypothetical protein
MSIDVEGHERAVLAGNDWQRFRPRVLVVEAVLPYTNTPCHQRWEQLLLDAGYHFAFFDGINRYYVREEDGVLLERFHCPVNVLDAYLPAEQYRLQEQIHRQGVEFHAQLQKVLAVHDQLAQKHQEMAQKHQELAEKLADAHRTLAQLMRNTGARTLSLGLGLARGLHSLVRLCDAWLPLRRVPREQRSPNHAIR